MFWGINDEKKTVASGREFVGIIKEQVSVHNEMSDEKKQKIEAKILSKLQSGKKLTPEEMNYLRRYNPKLYAHALRVQMLIKATEERLKHVRSKEEADQVIGDMMFGVKDDDPDKQYIVAAMNEISKNFHKSGAYSRLPNTEADAQRLKKNKEDSGYKPEEDDTQEDLRFTWSPLTEMIESMPTFEAGA